MQRRWREAMLHRFYQWTGLAREAAARRGSLALATAHYRSQSLGTAIRDWVIFYRLRVARRRLSSMLLERYGWK